MSKVLNYSSIDKEYAKQFELVSWIDKRFKIKLPADRKSLLSISCFDLAIEHHAAIGILCSSQLYGSMFALLRSVFEAYVRGLWLRYVANLKEVERYENEKLKTKFGDMIIAVESCIGMDSGPLSSVKNQSWTFMNSFTHSGFQQIVRRNADGRTGSVNYKITEVCSVLSLTGMFSLLSATELASFSDNHELIEQALQKAKEYAA